MERIVLLYANTSKNKYTYTQPHTYVSFPPYVTNLLSMIYIFAYQLEKELLNKTMVI